MMTKATPNLAEHETMPERSDDAKASIRSRMRKKLSELNPEERHRLSDIACRRLVSLDVFKHGSVIMLYMPLPSEVDTTAAAIRCFQTGKTVCVPKVDWDRRDMYAIEVSSFDGQYLETDDHGVRVPRGGRLVVPESIDLIVVPGLAFDAAGNRLGRGGGYYDRFLSRLRRSSTAAGMAFDLQVVDEVPVSARDMHVDVVVTDRRVTLARPSRSRR